MQLNGIDLVDRHNRPTVIQKTALKTYFINDGVYYDPAEVSGVTIFAKTANQTPSSLLTNNLLASSIPSSIILMHYTASAADSGSPGQDENTYAPGTDIRSTSGIYRVAQGEYVVVLDNTQETSGIYDFHGSSVTIQNTTSAVDEYLDCWTIKFADGSNYQTLINNFQLYNDTFFTTTQKVLLSTRNKLVNKHVTLDSVVDLKITTEVTIENKDLDESIKNIFRDSAITNASLKIEKVNDDAVALPSHVEVSGYSDTASLVDVTSDNTIIHNFDTTTLATHANVADFGGLVGNYRVTVKYSLLNETIISPPFYFTIN